MKPVPTQESNVTLVANGCFDLPAYLDAEHHFYQSVWELEEGELVKLLQSSKITLTVWGSQHPPVALEVLEGTSTDGN